MSRSLSAITLLIAMSSALPAFAADPAPAQSRRQMMKECMAKQKASDSGMPKADMRKACRDVTETAKENQDTAKEAAEDAPAAGKHD